MALTVGTDTYIGVADATTYVGQYYIATDAEFVAWAAAGAAGQEVLLRRACRTVDQQRYAGVKAVQSQILEFPRAIRTDAAQTDRLESNLLFDGAWVVQTEVPAAVKHAQVEEALALVVGVPNRIKLQRQGVKSFSLGSLSETYGSKPALRLLSHQARELLRPYMALTAAIV
jgi:hypothetical protein